MASVSTTPRKLFPYKRPALRVVEFEGARDWLHEKLARFIDRRPAGWILQPQQAAVVLGGSILIFTLWVGFVSLLP